MKANIHPTYYSDTKVVCACGNTFTTGSTLQQIRVEICAKCHPFFTGTQKFIDTLGQVERFQKKAKESKAKREQIQVRKAAKEAYVEEKKKDKPSLKELLMQARKSIAS